MNKRLLTSSGLKPLMAFAGHPLMRVKGRPASAPTMTRRHRDKVQSASGRLVSLDVIQLADGIYTDEQAIIEFVHKLNDADSTPTVNTDRAADAMKKLAAAGIA